MAKITRAELARRRRIALYKKVIIYGFLIMTIVPILTSVFLLYRVNQLEKELEQLRPRGDYPDRERQPGGDGKRRAIQR